MHATRSIGVILALAALFPFALSGAEDDCRASPARQDRLERVEDRGELVLASGGRAVLSDLHWADDDAIAGRAKAWLLQYRDRPLSIVQRGSPDRWGRSRVDASLDANPASDLAGGLIEAGLAMADAGEADALCRPERLAREAGPRAGSMGVWAGAVHDAHDGSAIQSIEGDFIVAQGRVLNVGERRKRTYLDFARRGETGLTVTVPKRTWRIMYERGLTAAVLRGRSVRVRGRVEVWRGPVLDIASADMIELLEGGQAPRR